LSPGKPMTSWLSPSVLARSAAEVVLSGLFANFADKREIEGGLSPETFECDPAATGTYWLDYASDVGDGFNSTYTIARLLARDEIRLGKDTTERGRVLVLGGDQVYPSASWERYDKRFKQPYAAALPPIEDETQRPQLFAVPGNHDWYDGLTSFMRVFCQRKSIGGWQTRQERSYFALELPHKWWLWGIDIQFDSYIDGPQIAYFKEASKRATSDHRIILATAKPSWVAVRDPANPPQSWMSLAYFQERVMCVHGAKLALTITGDLHHYARYEPKVAGDGSPKITAGGGGAYLSPTHWLPGELVLPPLTSTATTSYALAKAWPNNDTSRGMRAGILQHLLPWRTFSLNELIACIYALVALLLAVGIKDQDASLAPSLAEHGGWALFADSLTLWAVLLAAGLLAGLAAWARSGDVPRPLGVLHALLQLAAATVLTLLALEWDPFDWADNGFWLAYAAAPVVGIVGSLVGRWILVIYLFIVQQLNVRWHANEVFAAQARQAGTGFKHFVRFRIDAGGLRAYVIGVEDVPRKWNSYPRPEPTDGWPEPKLIDMVEIPPDQERNRTTSASSSP